MNVTVFRKTVSGSVHAIRDVESVVEGSQSRTAVYVQISYSLLTITSVHLMLPHKMVDVVNIILWYVEIFPYLLYL